MEMLQYAVKVAVSALLIVAVSEIAKRHSLLTAGINPDRLDTGDDLALYRDIRCGPDYRAIVSDLLAGATLIRPVFTDSRFRQMRIQLLAQPGSSRRSDDGMLLCDAVFSEKLRFMSDAAAEPRKNGH
jgi:hypothetical protein